MGKDQRGSDRRSRGALSALRVPNYRRYFFGQAVSLSGTWMQVAAQSWLVLRLTRSSTDVGIVVALQALPVLLIGPYGGVVADRVDKRRQMTVLQALMGIQAVVLGLLTVFNAVDFAAVCVLAFALGLNVAFELPSRQAFVSEMVGLDDVANAVSLNAVLINAARVIGPAVAGLVIALTSVGVCFLVNGVTFVAVVYSFVTMDRDAMVARPHRSTGGGQLVEGLRYVRGIKELWVPIAMMTMIGTLMYEFPVTLPVLATRSFHGGSRTFGFMYAAMGVGAMIGGFYSAKRRRTGLRAVIMAALAFGAAGLFAGLAPQIGLEYVALLVVGVTSVTFMTTGNSTVQVSAEAAMRGRVMSLWSVAYQGTTPIGGPAIGVIMAAANARVGLVIGATACFGAALIGSFAVRRTPRTSESLVQ
ncbi:MAG: transporter [Acidimicrobiaceae bacterium]|nr:transporter [Acidimicrobiaceae bacterium]